MILKGHGKYWGEMISKGVCDGTGHYCARIDSFFFFTPQPRLRSLYITFTKLGIFHNGHQLEVVANS